MVFHVLPPLLFNTQEPAPRLFPVKKNGFAFRINNGLSDKPGVDLCLLFFISGKPQIRPAAED
jgi:hypothetical protein